MTKETLAGDQVAALMTDVPGPRSHEMAKRLRKVESPNVTYLGQDFPIFWQRARGANVEDVDGNLFVDFTSAFGVASLGHASPVLGEAIQKQLVDLPHGMGDVHPPGIKVELLEKLTSLFPVEGARAILSSSGAEAVEGALKTAYLATHRPGVLTFQSAYHGLTYGALAVSGGQRFRKPFQSQVASFSHTVPLPKETNESIQQIEEVIVASEKSTHPIGSILFEPIFGRAGVVIPPKGWLSELRALATRKNVLLIADEVMTGFGRTGEWFAINHEKIVPDLLCVGKGFSGMLPFSACIGTKETMKAWPLSEGEALHTSTFLGHPLGCAAAIASMNEIKRLNLAEHAGSLGEKIQKEMQSWVASTPILTDVRGRGLMIGLELARGDESGLASKAATKALQKGLILLPSGEKGNVVSLTPPLTIAEEPLAWGLSTLKTVLSSM